MHFRFSLRLALTLLGALGLVAQQASGQQFVPRMGPPPGAMGPAFTAPLGTPYGGGAPIGMARAPYMSAPNPMMMGPGGMRGMVPGPTMSGPMAVPAERPAYRVSMADDEDPLDEPVGLYDESCYQRDCEQKDCAQKSCGCIGDCCCRSYALRVFADALYLRPRDAEVSYAVVVNSNLGLDEATPIQKSHINVLDPDYSTGVRFGVGVCLDACSEIAVSYTWYENSTSNNLERGANTQYQIDPMAVHPATRDGISGAVSAEGDLGVDFNLVDLDYRSYLIQNGSSNLNYLIGLRWGQLEQDFWANYMTNSETQVDTTSSFEGVGLRLGLEGERYYCRLPVMLYMKGVAGILAGDARATYRQTVQNNSSYGVDTGWEAGRLVPTFDFELGGGIYGCCGGHVQITAGYVYSIWGNVVKTEDWIRSVQSNNFDDLGDTMTFDGFVGRIEARF